MWMVAHNTISQSTEDSVPHEGGPHLCVRRGIGVAAHLGKSHRKQFHNSGLAQVDVRTSFLEQAKVLRALRQVAHVAKYGGGRDREKAQQNASARRSARAGAEVWWNVAKLYKLMFLERYRQIEEFGWRMVKHDQRLAKSARRPGIATSAHSSQRKRSRRALVSSFNWWAWSKTVCASEGSRDSGASFHTTTRDGA